MANLGKVVKVTETQYDTLLSGGTVGGETYSDDNIYLVDGSSLYRHTVVLTGYVNTSYTSTVYMEIMSNRSTSYDLDSLATYLEETTHNNPLLAHTCSGYAYGGTSYTTRYASSIYGTRSGTTNYINVTFYPSSASNVTDYIAWAWKNTSGNQCTGISDTVTKIL